MRVFDHFEGENLKLLYGNHPDATFILFYIENTEMVYRGIIFDNTPSDGPVIMETVEEMYQNNVLRDLFYFSFPMYTRED